MQPVLRTITLQSSKKIYISFIIVQENLIKNNNKKKLIKQNLEWMYTAMC